MTDDTTDTPASADGTTDADESPDDATTATSAKTDESSHDADDRGNESDDRRESIDSRSDDADARRDDARSRPRRGGAWANATLRERLQWLALVVLVLVAVATLFSFYTNVSRFISIWATREYEPALQAAFALAVLATSLAGIARLSRNLN